jgi:hypothetical protein
VGPRVRPHPRVPVVLAALGICLALVAPGAQGFTPPPLPASEYIGFLSNLSVPVTAPGSTANLVASVHNPLALALTETNLSFEFYAYNAFPGNATGAIPGGATPSFTGGGGTGTAVAFLLGTLAPGATTPVRSEVVVPSNAAAGDYAIRARLTFVANGTYFILESRGFFTAAEWTNATRLAGNASTLNVSDLGVSGVLPETALPVRVTSFPWVLAALVVGAVVCAAVGGYYAARRGPGSSSGASSARPPRSAARALGKSVNSDGD